MCDMNFFSPGANKMRIIAIPCLIFGVIQLSYAASAANVVTHKIVGSWWAGLIIVLTTILTGMKATNMCSVVSAIILGILSIVSAIVACFIDAILAAHFNELEGCVGNGKLYGRLNEDGASECGMSYTENECLCWDDDDDWDSECYIYDINEDYDCGYLLDEVPNYLRLSAWFAGISMITMIVFSCMACAVTCCPDSCGHYDPDVIDAQKRDKEAADAAAIQRQAQLQQPGQPQMVYPGQVPMQQQQPQMVYSGQQQQVYPGQMQQQQQQQNLMHPGQVQMQQQQQPQMMYPGQQQQVYQQQQPDQQVQMQQQEVSQESTTNPIQMVPVVQAAAPQAKPLPP